MTKLPRLKELRLKEKLSQFEFARRIGLKQQQYSRYEIGKYEPPIAHIKKICETFDVTSDWLLEINPGRQSPPPEEEGEE